jgi:hypothetical protein
MGDPKSKWLPSSAPLRPAVGTVLGFIGGGIGRVAAAGLVGGILLVASGMTPAELVEYLWRNPPTWVSSDWTRLLVLILGLVIVGSSLRFNRWSQQQKAIDELAEDMAWAIRHLLNRDPRPSTDEEVAQWEKDFREWCNAISKKLDNRAFFTRADQLHFDRLGFVDPLIMSGHKRFNWLLAQLRLKFERLRDVLNWVQQRRH